MLNRIRRTLIPSVAQRFRMASIRSLSICLTLMMSSATLIFAATVSR